MGFKEGFALAMSAVYVLCGVLLGFTDAAAHLIPRYRPALAIVLIGYGILRCYLWWRRRKDEGKAL